MRIFLLGCLGVSLLLASTGITLPLPLVLLFLLYVFERNEWVFVAACVSGLIIDGFWMQQIGLSSLFFVLYLFIVELYERKFELLSVPFIIAFSFVGSLVYLLLFIHRYSLPAAIVSCGITLCVFLISKRFTQQKERIGFD